MSKISWVSHSSFKYGSAALNWPSSMYYLQQLLFLSAVQRKQNNLITHSAAFTLIIRKWLCQDL